MLENCASILDYPHPGLNPVIWTSESKFQPELKLYILEIIHSFLLKHGLKQSEEWIKLIKIVGSLTSYQYLKDSDLDVHIVVDLDRFQKLEKPTLSKEEAWAFLDELRKRPDLKGHLVPNTEHPLEIYFESPFSSTDPNANKYDLIHDKWLKEATPVSADFDIEEIKPFIVDLANELAEEMDISLGNIRRDIKRIEELDEVIKEWEPKYKQAFQSKLEDRLEKVESEIRELVEIKDEVAEKRKTYGPDSEQEIKFKYLQRFGYFYIITQLKTLLDENNDTLKKEDLPRVKEIILNPQDKKADFNRTAYGAGAGWVSPQGKFYPVGYFHHLDWVYQHPELFKFVTDEYLEHEHAEHEAQDEALREGWVRVAGSQNRILYVNAHSFQTAEQALSSWLPDNLAGIDTITLETNENIEGYEASTRSFLEDGWSAFRRNVRADFMPSFSAGDPGVDMSKPSDISDEENYNNPIVDKPRKDRWTRFLSMFMQKKEAAAPLDPGWILPDNRFVPLHRPEREHVVNILEKPERYGLKPTNPILAELREEEKVSYYSAVSFLLSKGFIRVAGVSHGGLFIQLASFDQSTRTEEVIFKHLSHIKVIVIEAGAEVSSATAENFKEVGFDAFTRPVAAVLKRATPPPNEAYREKKITPMGFTELWTFYQQATPEDIAEVEDLLDADKFKEAYALVEKYLGRSHLKLGSEELEPFKPLPVTYDQKTNNDNLNWRYPWKFMKVPTGSDFSNEGIVDQMILKNVEENRKNSSLYSNEDMQKIYDKQKLENDDPPGDNQGGGNVYHDFNSDTSQYPKKPSKPKFTLDQLTPPPNGTLPDYSISWYISQPAEDNGKM